MKKHNLAEFFKSKGFYALLCVGAFAIVVIAMVQLNQTSENNKSNNLVDLNEPINSDVAVGEDSSSQEIGTAPDTNNTASSTAANNEKGNSQTEVAQGDSNNQGTTDQKVTDESLLEFESDDDPKGVAANDASNSTSNAGTVTSETADTKKPDEASVSSKETTDEKEKEQTASDSEKEDSQAVMKPETLYFDPESGLLWPVTGNVLMNYSVDRVIYHETLEQFRCNPAIILDAEVGTEVLNAAKGIITSITNEDETGLTVTASIGSGYSVVYGQLKDVSVEVGDTVLEGSVLGAIADPTKYYTVEGSNLYFEVFKDEETINPMLLLR